MSRVQMPTRRGPLTTYGRFAEQLTSPKPAPAGTPAAALEQAIRVAGERLARATHSLEQAAEDVEAADFAMSKLCETHPSAMTPGARVLRAVLPTIPELLTGLADQVKVLQSAAAEV